MMLVDAQNYSKASTSDQFTVQCLKLPGTSETQTGEKLIQMYPVEVLAGTTSTPQMYVLSMTFDDDSSMEKQ